jgi:nucleoside-diphosphate-sugar epimerase
VLRGDRPHAGLIVPHPLAGCRVLVTGASGFIGGRLAERLAAQCGARVRVLVRRVMGATPVARYPAEIVVGDMSEERTIVDAVGDCAVVFNCAKGKGADPARRWAVDVDGPGRLVEAARRTGARVVHVSTMAVYDRPRDGFFDETAPDAPKGDAYSDAKLAGERRALEWGARDAVPVTVIQPAAVYGPNAGVYGREIVEELRSSRVILVNGGDGICNAVYIDDVVTALLLAATNDRAPGHRFLVSGFEYPTWAQFFGHFERMLGASRTVSMTEAEALALWYRSQRRPWLAPELWRAFKQDVGLRTRLLATADGAAVFRAAERFVPALVRKHRPAPPTATAAEVEVPVSAIRPWVIRNTARKARVRIDKARELLGYTPVFDLEQGMRLTEQWARWAGLLS